MPLARCVCCGQVYEVDMFKKGMGHVCKGKNKKTKVKTKEHGNK